MNADELKKDVIAAMNAAVCGALDTGSLIDIEKTAQSIADKYAQLSAQSAVQPVADAVDAKRYRWLRVAGDAETYLHNQPGINNCKQIAGDGLDAAIDAARAQSTEGAKG